MLSLLSLIHRKTKRTTMTNILDIDIVSQRHCHSINTSVLLTTILPCWFIRSTNNYHSLLLLLVLLLIRWYHLKKHHNNNLYRLKSIRAYLMNDVLALVISHRLSHRTEYSCGLFQHIYPLREHHARKPTLLPSFLLLYHHHSMTRIRSRTHITFHSNFSPFSKQG